MVDHQYIPYQMVHALNDEHQTQEYVQNLLMLMDTASTVSRNTRHLFHQYHQTGANSLAAVLSEDNIMLTRNIPQSLFASWSAYDPVRTTSRTEYRSDAVRVAETAMLWIATRNTDLFTTLSDALVSITDTLIQQHPESMLMYDAQQLIAWQISTALSDVLHEFPLDVSTPWAWQEPVFMQHLYAAATSHQRLRQLYDDAATVFSAAQQGAR